jgi:hypothetical protein
MSVVSKNWRPQLMQEFENRPSIFVTGFWLANKVAKAMVSMSISHSPQQSNN